MQPTTAFSHGAPPAIVASGTKLRALVSMQPATGKTHGALGRREIGPELQSRVHEAREARQAV